MAAVTPPLPASPTLPRRAAKVPRTLPFGHCRWRRLAGEGGLLAEEGQQQPFSSARSAAACGFCWHRSPCAVWHLSRWRGRTGPHTSGSPPASPRCSRTSRKFRWSLEPTLQHSSEVFRLINVQVASASETEPEASERRLRELSASEREKAVLASLHAAASSMHLDIQEDSPLMEERSPPHITTPQLEAVSKSAPSSHVPGGH